MQNKAVHLGDIIASKRRLKRIQQTDFAKSLGVSNNYLSQVENGRTTGNVKLLVDIAKKLDTTLADLLYAVIETTDEEKELFIKAKPLFNKMLVILAKHVYE